SPNVARVLIVLASAKERVGMWMVRIGASDGNDIPTTGDMGLRDHLDEAVEQADGRPLVFQLVIYNLPGRDCAALASNGELGPEEIDRYQDEYIDPIVDIDRKSTRLNSSHVSISYAVFCLKKKTILTE